MSNIERVEIIKRNLISDDRGWFLKAITGTENKLPERTGEIYLTMGKKGQTKGGHYHPKALEWFTLIKGRAILKLEDVKTHERQEVEMSLDNPQTIFIPNYVAHQIENRDDEDFILLAYTDLLYNPKDTIPYQL